MNEDWLEVPVGRKSEGWVTAQTERTVLAVVHTLAGVCHITDAIELLEPDHRIQIVFTQAPDLFSNGVSRYLERLGAIVIPWQQAVHTDFDLAVVSDAAEIYKLHAPVLLVPHGVMNNKWAPAALAGADNDVVAGLGAPWLTRFGRLVPAALALTHDGLVDVLRQQCRQAVAVASVVGDLCLDRLVESRVDSRQYREELGVGQDEVLIAVSSTWGPHSLFGRCRTHVYELVAQLPAGHRAVAVMHPALWYGHGPRQVMAWLATARRHGLRLVHPLDWRAVVAAADVLIGDHGSATVYAAAAGVPVLRIDDAPESVKTGSAVARLAQLSLRMSSDRSLADQLHEAIKSFDKEMHRAISERVTSRPHQAAELMRSLMYRLLALPEPTGKVRPTPVNTPGMVISQGIGYG